jgi:hypothetical protein
MSNAESNTFDGSDVHEIEEAEDIRAVITKKELIRLNTLAIKRRYNKSLKPELLERLPDVFGPTGNPTRFNFQVDHDTSSLSPDCERIMLWLPLDPSNVSGSFGAAWLDVKRGDMRALYIRLSRP